MSSHLKSLANTIWHAAPAALPEWPPLTAAAQTRLSWARRIEGYDELPAVFKPFFDRNPPAGGFPYAVLTPAYAGFLSRTTEKLFCACAPWIHVLENTGGACTTTTFHVDAINCVEAGTVLLKSWLTLAGRTVDGVDASVTLKFNTVGDYLFAPVVERIRGTCSAPPEAVAAERRKFDYLQQEHFKFMNAARRSILPGEQVLASVMQPEMRKEVVRLFGRTFHRPVAPAHILILTDNELILVAEEEQPYWSREPKYGSIRTTVPLRLIEEATLQQMDEDTQLVVRLPGDARVASRFERGQGAALRDLLDKLAHATDAQRLAQNPHHSQPSRSTPVISALPPA